MTIKQHDVTTRLYFNDYFNTYFNRPAVNNSQRTDSANDNTHRVPSGVRPDLGKPGINMQGSFTGGIGKSI